MSEYVTPSQLSKLSEYLDHYQRQDAIRRERYVFSNLDGDHWHSVTLFVDPDDEEMNWKDLVHPFECSVSEQRRWRYGLSEEPEPCWTQRILEEEGVHWDPKTPPPGIWMVRAVDTTTWSPEPEYDSGFEWRDPSRDDG